MRLPVLTFVWSIFIIGISWSCSSSDDSEKVPSKDGRIPELGLVGTAPSGQRQLVEAALINAQRTGRPLMLEFEGAWCPPCATLQYRINNSSALQDTLKSYDILHLDEVFYEPYQVYDFSPGPIFWYPSAFIYLPAANTWIPYLSIAEESADPIIEDLQTIANGQDWSALLAERIRSLEQKALQAEAAGASQMDPVDADALYSALTNSLFLLLQDQGLEKSFAAIRQLYQERILKHDIFSDVDLNYQAQALTQRAIAAEPAKMQTYSAQFELLAQDIGLDVSESAKARRQLNAHEAHMTGLLAQDSPEAAARYCREVYRPYADKIVDVIEEPLIGQLFAELTCLGLRRLNQDPKVPEDAGAVLASLEDNPDAAKYRTSYRLPYYAGDFATAAAWSQSYYDRLLASRQKTLEEYRAAVEAGEKKPETIEIWNILMAREKAAYSRLIEQLKAENKHPVLSEH